MMQNFRKECLWMHAIVFGDVYIYMCVCGSRRMKEERNACGMIQKSSFLRREERENKDGKSFGFHVVL